MLLFHLMVNLHGNDLGVTFLSSFNDLGMKEMMLEWLFFILGWWLNDWNEVGMKKFLMKDKCPWFVFSIFPFLIVPYLIIWHSFYVWNEHGIVFNHSTLSFLIFFTIPMGCRWKLMVEWPEWCCNEDISYGENFDHPHPLVILFILRHW